MEQRRTYLRIRKLRSSIHTLQLYEAPVPAGPGQPEIIRPEDSDWRKSLPIKTASTTYYVKVRGNDMIDAFIPSGGMLVVDRSLQATTGDIVVALLNGEFTIKRLMNTPGGIYLTPANLKYKTIKVSQDMNFRVWGVVVRSIGNGDLVNVQ